MSERRSCRRWVAIVAASIALAPASTLAQSAGGQPAQSQQSGDDEKAWSLRASAAAYVFPDDDDYVQPTVAFDRGALHLESRYNYEDRESVSGFVGWNLEFGSTVALQLTPMFGAVVGQTDAIVPALEFDLSWRRLEFYSEGEWVIDVGERSNNFLYNWSEASVWATEWLRGGLVTQRTRAYQSPREIQRGLLIGLSFPRFEPVLYIFNPGSDDHFFVASFSVEF